MRKSGNTYICQLLARSKVFVIDPQNCHQRKSWIPAKDESGKGQNFDDAKTSFGNGTFNSNEGAEKKANGY